MRVHRFAKRGVTREVNIGTGHIRPDKSKLIVRQHPVVAAKAFTKRHVACRRQPHHLDAAALCHLKRRAIGGFAGCTRQQHHGLWPVRRGGTEVSVVCKKIVNQPGSCEQRAQQRLQVFTVCCVKRVSAAARVLVVNSVELGAVRRTVCKRQFCGPGWREVDVGSHREVAV